MITAGFKELHTGSCVLFKKIRAIPVVSDIFGDPEFGPLGTLPEAAEVAFCGRGFDGSTARIRWNNQHYIVFLQDLGYADYLG